MDIFSKPITSAVVYDKNGVTIRSFPAIHAGNGPLSLILEYTGMKIVIGGDTYPNKWYIKHAVDADVGLLKRHNPRFCYWNVC